jgi:hypothetical protein
MTIRVTLENLTPWVPAWLPLPKTVLVRMYSCETEPVEPHQYKFAVVALIWCGVAEIKGLCKDVDLKHMKAGSAALGELGARKLVWTHKGHSRSLTIR